MNDAQKQIHESRLTDGRLPAFTSVGGYPLVYLAADGGCLCATCATSDGQTHDDSDPQWHLVGCDVHWEGEPLTCDHCGDDIESAYGEVLTAAPPLQLTDDDMSQLDVIGAQAQEDDGDF